MQDGTFNRCAPDMFFDSGGEFGNYGNDENFSITICPQNANEFIILNFTAFSTQLNTDIMTIYDGDDNTANVLGTFSGVLSPGTISASDTNTSGCLTVEFTSNGSGNTTGWAAEILCAVPCQDITASIDSTNPPPNVSGVVSILPGETVDFSGSATFSVDGTNATYDWDFGDTNTATGTDVSNTYATQGTYTVTLTVSDDNPQGCSGTATITVFVLGPNVVIDQDTYTPEELIEEVLINSPCAEVSNIIWSTGISFAATEPNGIGYFISDGNSFPFRDGVILTSGDASEARGPNNNAMSAGSGAWPGDGELNTAVGITSNNASFIQFDFIPLADSISFDFLMASEEYDGDQGGSFECTFSDAFAFLLTDPGGNTTNLAVLPGTNTPILVTNIHPANNGCAAINEQFFGGYTPQNGPPISFDGRTAVFTAQSTVIPGAQYTIKLVVADATDTALDSGVFLRAGSFDLGGDLGDDITIAAGTAECGGSSITLDTNAPAADHVWYFNGVEITGETSSTLDVTEAGEYSVDVVFSGVCQASDSIIVEFRPNPTANPAQDLFICDTGTGVGQFTLTDNDSVILGGQDPADFIITYHLTEQDAIDNVGALPDNYTNTSDPQTIYARIADNTQFCFDTVSFTLNVSGQPDINPVPDLELCDDASNDGQEEFDLDSQTLGILGTQSAADFTVTYHTSFADADAGTGALPLMYTNGMNPEPIYVRVEAVGDSNCYNASPNPVFNLIVNDLAIANTPADMELCDDPSLDGFETFDLSTQEAQILGAQDPAVFNVSFHETQADADAGLNPLPLNYTNTTPNTQVIYVRVEDPLHPECFGTTTFNLIVNPLPTVIVPTPLQECDDATADGFTTFNLTDKTIEILNGQTGVDVSYHQTLADASADTNEIFDGYINTIPTIQTIGVRLEDTTTGCFNVTTLDLEVLVNPVAIDPTPLEACDDDADGETLFDLTVKNAEIIGIQTGVSVTYHPTQADAEAGTATLPNNYTSDTAVIYVRLEDDVTGCFDTTTLQLIVNPLPTFPVITNFELCDDNNPGDETEIFDLTTKDVEIINGQVNVIITYFPTLADAQAGTSAIVGPYANTANPETIYVSLENTITGCRAISNFDLIVNPLPQFIVPTPLAVCDDGTPDGLTTIDLTIKISEITGNNPDYGVTYYPTQADADAGTNPLPNMYNNISNPETIFVRIQDINTGCFDTTTLDLVVEQAPIAFTPQPLRYCDPDNDGFGVFTLTDADNEITGGAAGLTVTYHETQANADNNVDAIDTSVPYNNIVANNQTLYARVESATIATNCATIVELELIVEPTPQIEDPSPLGECDDISADGIAQFDLTTKDAEILNGLDPLQYIVTYYETQANAEAGTNPIATPTAYTNTTAFSQIIWVRVEDINTVGGCFKITTLELIVHPLPVLVQPMPLELCDVNNPGDEQEAFTLENANAEILNGQTGITLTYYETQADADNATNPIFSDYTNTSNPQTIYVRAENDVTGCVNTITVTLRVNPIPSPEPNPTPIQACDIDNDGFEVFNLEIRTVEIINGELDVVITYHETEADADNGVNAIPNPTAYTNIVPNNQMIYVRSENTLTGCYSLTANTLELIVLPSPEVPTNIEDFVICDTNADGFAQFDLTTKDAEILGVQDPANFTLTYHVSQADADTGNNPIINVGSYTNLSNPQTIYVRLVSNGNGCITTGSFIIRVELPPTAVQPTPLELCDDLGESPGDEITEFDLTVKNNEITGGNPSWSVTYYETQADAQAGTNAIPDPMAYTNTSVGGNPANPQTLYVVVTDTDTGCVDFTTLTIRVLPNPTPTPSDQLPELELCDDINTGDGVEEFDLVNTDNLEVIILNGELGVTATYYEDPDDAEAGVNAIPDPTAYTNTQSPEQIIYVRVTNDITGCFTLVNFTIRVNPLPDVVAVTDFIACEVNNDGFYDFDLTTKDAEVLNGQDPAEFTVTYHETQADADNLMNALVSDYTNTTNPQQIFVAITNNTTGCSISTQSFNLEVQEGAEANSDMDPILYQICDDNVEDDGDPSNDSAQFDLSTQDGFVLDGQDPASYTVSYYATLEDATLGVNPLPNLYENLTNPQVIYARVDNDTLDGTGADTSICFAVAELTLQVNPLPLFDLEDSYILCVDTNGTEVIDVPVLDTGLSEADYSFEWSFNGTVLPGETGSSLTPSQGGLYSVTVTNNATGCQSSDSAEVIESAPPTLVATVTTQAFADPHVIEAVATGIGEYEYSLDGGPWQDSGIFTGVSAGEHVITARDRNGCGIATTEVLVIDYPLYFTPNGDGNHDRWNITGIDTQPSAKIYIFDRYGKLLKQLSPTGEGWNGTYNGNLMPSSDYWFMVLYNEPSTGERKEFKAHFTLKR